MTARTAYDRAVDREDKRREIIGDPHNAAREREPTRAEIATWLHAPIPQARACSLPDDRDSFDLEPTAEVEDTSNG